MRLIQLYMPEALARWFIAYMVRDYLNSLRRTGAKFGRGGRRHRARRRAMLPGNLPRRGEPIGDIYTDRNFNLVRPAPKPEPTWSEAVESVGLQRRAYALAYQAREEQRRHDAFCETCRVLPAAM